MESIVNEIVSESKTLELQKPEIVDALVQALEKDASWVSLYEITGELVIPAVQIGDDDVGRALTEVKKVCVVRLITTQKTSDGIWKLLNQPRRLEEFSAEWREIIIPVDVPQMHVSRGLLSRDMRNSIPRGQILAAASLQISSNPFSTDPAKALDLFAGQPIHAILTIRTSFHWAPIEDSDTQTYHMRFDVEEMSKDWLVSGRKRGDFVAVVSNAY